MFKKILIANRGEIACRVASTARKLGVQTVAVYSEADAHAKHVAACDEAVCVGAAPARESYLRADVILQAALQTGAQAVHPGYGFLSENEHFAQECAKHHITFIGPPASAIAAMGSKSAAKTLMEKAGVPLVPGYHGSNQDAAFLQSQANNIGYPVLIKASAGGGGKGMRVVENAASFAENLASCQREARNSFGDDQVLIEKYLTRPRHIEIQVFADTHGNCVYLFERDCSVQRRHQKVLEEAPAPGLSAAQRTAMGQAAVAAARAVNYVGAGTVEFIVEGDVFYFMEMNTRLQVEHPVTEMITGFDLVEWQLRIACGELLPVTQTDLAIHGHAIEARIYAENPENQFLPSTGTLKHLKMPRAHEFGIGEEIFAGSPPITRIDAGVRVGDTITPFYDPMIAKLIVWGKTRSQALSALQVALAQTQIVGLHTNVAFLQRVLTCPDFASGAVDTGLIERNRASLFPPAQPASLNALALAVAHAWVTQNHAATPRNESENNWQDPWEAHSASVGHWRLSLPAVQNFVFEQHEQTVCLSLEAENGQTCLRMEDQTWPWALLEAEGLADDSTPSESLRVQWGALENQRLITGSVVAEGETLHVFCYGQHTVLTMPDWHARAAFGHQEVGVGGFAAPMPGKVMAVHVIAGAQVKKGQPLLVMEAMKMEHTIVAPTDGLVEEVLYAVGDQVSEGASLLRFTPAEK